MYSRFCSSLYSYSRLKNVVQLQHTIWTVTFNTQKERTKSAENNQQNKNKHTNQNETKRHWWKVDYVASKKREVRLYLDWLFLFTSRSLAKLRRFPWFPESAWQYSGASVSTATSWYRRCLHWWPCHLVLQKRTCPRYHCEWRKYNREKNHQIPANYHAT